MKRMTWMKGAIAVALMTGVSWAFAADHLDAPKVSMDPPSDITDVYTWLDGNNVVLVMNVAPLATNMSKFSDKVQYVFHTESTGGYGQAGMAVDVICTFALDQTIQCWVGNTDYVKGDASKPAGLKSMSGKVNVFAGLRDDPFFFNLDGFKDTVKTVVMAAPALPKDMAGCPTVDAATSTLLVTKLKSDPTVVPPGPGKDFFAGKNVLSIVLAIDKTLLNAGGAYMNVWGSTNTGS